jgi:hypothetical protein
MKSAAKRQKPQLTAAQLQDKLNVRIAELPMNQVYEIIETLTKDLKENYDEAKFNTRLALFNRVELVEGGEALDTLLDKLGM